MDKYFPESRIPRVWVFDKSGKCVHEGDIPYPWDKQLAEIDASARPKSR